ncbi:MAG: hypothetical protein K8T10_02630 [Candidatus Eremiobacteraeota bacterium]|nr:hypothetical protein [Candidatus Eremiobacteraeota bacterium]
MSSTSKIRGFSLVENLGSLILVLLLVVFVFSVYPQASLAIKQVEHIEVATALGNKILEERINKKFSDIQTETGTQTHTIIQRNNSVSTAYDYNLSVTSLNDKLKNLTLVMSWQDRNQPRTLTLQTIVFKKTE